MPFFKTCGLTHYNCLNLHLTENMFCVFKRLKEKFVSFGKLLTFGKQREEEHHSAHEAKLQLLRKESLQSQSERDEFESKLQRLEEREENARFKEKELEVCTFTLPPSLLIFSRKICK